MSANTAFHIAVLPGDGIGPEVMAPGARYSAPDRGDDAEPRNSASRRRRRRRTIIARPASRCRRRTIKLCEKADAILLGACGLPSVRYPDNTEIMPQVELRFIFDLYAGVRPARLIPGVPSPIVGAAERGIDFVLIRELTEGLFASMGKGVVTHDEARETLVVTRKTTRAAVRLLAAARRAAQGARQAGPAHAGRQGQRVQGLQLAARHLRRAPGEISRRQDRPALCRCLRRA